MSYSAQVEKSHYAGAAYRSQERWDSYFYQLSLVESVKAKDVLEVGVGGGIVARELVHRGVKVTTLDIAEDVSPDIVGSVTDIPLENTIVDAALAFEVLEHLRFEDLLPALKEMARVSRRFVIISLPHPGWVFSCIVKVPLLPRFEFFFQIPFFWKTHAFNGEHYWELGKRGYPVSVFVRCAREAGLRLTRYERHASDPAHRFFVFEKI